MAERLVKLEQVPLESVSHEDVPIPLQPGEAEPTLHLNRVLHELYDRAGYDLAVDYRRPPDPPLASEEDMQWMSELLQAADF